ncbi:MAG: class I SAM-dependent methyltransferase, partial [Planctomycetota bacterium]
MTEVRPFHDRMGLGMETYDARAEGWADHLGGDVEFFLVTAEEAGDPVLELGAGTGRVTWPLADAGHRVVGLDLSEPMLALARKKGEGRPGDVRARARFVHGDMRDFRLDDAFPLVLVPFRSFQCLLTPEDQMAALTCTMSHLVPGGRLVVNLFDPLLDRCTPDAHPFQDDRDVRNPFTGKIVRSSTVHRENDTLAQVFTEDWRFTEIDDDGTILREETERLTMRWTFRHEARHLFERCGFEVEGEYSDFRRSPPAYGKE